jgi:hypothetical protein
MKKTILAILCALVALTSGTARAQAAIFPPNALGVTMGHWHLNSKDVEATKKILVAMVAPQSRTATSRS